MEILNADKQRDVEINNLLQRIKYETNKQEIGGDAYFPIHTIDGNKNINYKENFKYKEDFTTISLFKELKKLGAIEFTSRTIDEMNKSLEESRKSKGDFSIGEGYLVKPIEPKFSQLCEEYEKKTSYHKNQNFWIVKDEDGNYYHKGCLLDNVSKGSDYYEVFSILFDLIPKGGRIAYSRLEEEVRKRLSKTKNMASGKLRVFIQRNLTDEQNGFLRYAKIDNSVTGGKKLIKAVRAKGIDFNNVIQ